MTEERIYRPSKRAVFRSLAGPRTITDVDIVMFDNIFLTPNIIGRNKEAHANMLLPIADGLTTTPTSPQGLLDAVDEAAKKLVGDKPRPGGAFLGITKLKLYRPVRPGDTVYEEAEFESARTSRSKPDMVITNIIKTLINQNGEKVLEAHYRYGSW